MYLSCYSECYMNVITIVCLTGLFVLPFVALLCAALNCRLAASCRCRANGRIVVFVGFSVAMMINGFPTNADKATNRTCGAVFPPRQASVGFVGDLGPGDVGDLPPVSNLCVSAIARGTNSTDILVSLANVRRPVGEIVDLYVATDLTLWDWIKPYSFDVSSVASNFLVSVFDDSVSTNGVLPKSFYSVGDAADSDCDGVSDSDERFLSRTDPLQPDTDADGFNDGWEIVFASLGYYPLSADTNGLLAASADLDGDGLTNYQEQMLGTDVGNPDSDGDGISDGAEIPSASLLAATVQIGMQLAMSGQMPNPWYIIPALGSCSNPCVTNSSEFVPVAFYFGDPSTSHSEKYLLTLVPVSGSGYGAEPPSVSLLNGQYGVCDMALVFLRKSWHYEVRLAHSATNIPLPEGKDPDYALIGAAASPAVMLYDPAELLGVSSVTNGIFNGDGKVAHIYVLGDPEVAPDYDRDGQITESERERAKLGSPFRFWVNDDNDSGDVSESADDIPGSGSNGTDSTVNGYSDVEDFTPLLLDISKVFPIDAPEFIRARVSWKLQSETVNAVWTALSATDAGMFQTEDCGAVFGSGLSQGVTNAAVVGLSGGVVLPAEFKVAMEQNDGQGVVLAEGCAAGANVYLIGLVDGAEALTGKVNMVVSSVEDMYRWMNLRNICGDESGLASNLSSPTNWPDVECDGRHFVFVHGYNVNVQSARGWAAEMFKRLWQAGSQSMFTAVDWYGDESQIWGWVPLVGGESPDYYVNVAHALDTALNFSVTANGLPGDKVILAHSLGNVLASEAAENYALSYSRYYMLNAALPVEAFAPSIVNSEMIEHAWTNINTRLFSANWHECFEDYLADSRKDLKWRGRYVNVQNAVNCYSPTEDVLANATTNGWGGAWSMQELFKGTAALHVIPGNCEGGWGFNDDYANLLGTDLTEFAKTNEWTSAELIENPMFRLFDDANTLHSTNEILLAQTDANLILGDGIPATSFAAGANPIPQSSGYPSINFHAKIAHSDTWPRKKNDQNVWYHSDLKKMPYYYVHLLFETINEGEEE